MLAGVILLIISVLRCSRVGGAQAGLSAIAEKTKDLSLTPIDHIGLWATVLMTSFGTWGLPQMIHKYYGIRDDKEVKRGTVISTIFAFVVAGGGYFIGSLSRLFYSDLAELPGAGSGKTDYLIPNMLNIAGLSDILVGVILVLLIAASVSTLSSITITASTTLSMDFIIPHFFPKKDKVWDARLTKIICFAFVAVSYFIANSDTPILDMMSYSWGVISGAFLAPYLLSLYWKKINTAGAWAGMITGFVVALPPMICRLFSIPATIGSFGKIMDLGPHFACLSAVLSCLMCVVFSLAVKSKENSFVSTQKATKTVSNETV